MIQSNYLKSLTKLHEITMSGSQENGQKTSLYTVNGQFWDQERVQKSQTYLNFNFLFFTININRLEENRQKLSKTTCCHPQQCVFDQRYGQNIFPAAIVPLSDSNQLYQVSGQVT